MPIDIFINEQMNEWIKLSSLEVSAFKGRVGKLIEHILPMGSEGLILHLLYFNDIFGREDVVDTKVSCNCKNECSQNYPSKVPFIAYKV